MYNTEFDINIYNDSLSLGELLPPSLHWRSPINKRIKLCMIYSAAQRTKISNNSIFHSYIWNHPRLFQFWNWHFLGISSFNVTFYLTLVSLWGTVLTKKNEHFIFFLAANPPVGQSTGSQTSHFTMDEEVLSLSTWTTSTRWSILYQLSGPEGSVITQLEVNKT